MSDKNIFMEMNKKLLTSILLILPWFQFLVSYLKSIPFISSNFIKTKIFISEDLGNLTGTNNPWSHTDKYFQMEKLIQILPYLRS